MALSVDTAKSGVSTGLNIANYTSSFVIGSSADFLLAMPAIGASVVGSSVSNVTWGGVGMSRVSNSARTQVEGGGGLLSTELWSLVAPLTSTQTLVVTTTGGVVRVINGAVISFIGAHQTVPLGAAVVNSSTNANGTISISVASGEIGAAVLYTASSGAANHSFADSTERWETDEQAQIGSGADGATKPGVASTMTAVNEAGGWSISAVAVKPAGAAAATRLRLPPQFSGMGVGGVLFGNIINKFRQMIYEKTPYARY